MKVRKKTRRKKIINRAYCNQIIFNFNANHFFFLILFSALSVINRENKKKKKSHYLFTLLIYQECKKVKGVESE